MARTLLLIGTRKGLFTLESENRRDWSYAGRCARAGPSTTRSTTRGRARSTPPPRATGTAPRCGGAPTSARRGRSRARASPTTRRASARCRRSPRSPRPTGSCSSAPRRPGSSRSTDGGETLLAARRRWPASPEARSGTTRNQPPGPPRHLDHHARPRRPGPLLGDRAGRQPLRDARRRRDVGAAQQGPPRRLAAAARGRRLLRPPHGALARRPAAGCTSRTTSACTAPTTAATVDGDHRGPAERVRLRRRHAPARQGHLLRHPARPRPRADDARGQGRGLAHEGRRRELAQADERACRRTRRTSACCAAR